MRVSVALFTADLRVHDNPVLQAALRDADRVAPLFVVDTGICRAGLDVPNCRGRCRRRVRCPASAGLRDRTRAPGW
ncbi:deoxyribodipyrimidine photo-lyase [Streptomyces bobili]